MFHPTFIRVQLRDVSLWIFHLSFAFLFELFCYFYFTSFNAFAVARNSLLLIRQEQSNSIFSWLDNYSCSVRFHKSSANDDAKWRGVNSAFAKVKQRHRFRTRRLDLANPEAPIYPSVLFSLRPSPSHFKSSRYKFIAWNIDEPEG